MTPGRTHYDVLGLARDATLEDIHANYRLRLAQLKGRAGASPADVAALRMAHVALSDPARRAAYDKSLAPPPRARERLVPTLPHVEGIERSWWQSTPVMLLGVALLIAIALWGWKPWRKPVAVPRGPALLAPPPKAAPAAARPQAPRIPKPPAETGKGAAPTSGK